MPIEESWPSDAIAESTAASTCTIASSEKLRDGAPQEADANTDKTIATKHLFPGRHFGLSHDGSKLLSVTIASTGEQSASLDWITRRLALRR
jgi:hypothetical protein